MCRFLLTDEIVSMSALSILYVFLFYVAMITLVAGVTNKMLQYKRVPAPLKIVVTPAPLTRKGVAYRFFTEVVLFNSLYCFKTLEINVFYLIIPCHSIHLKPSAITIK